MEKVEWRRLSGEGWVEKVMVVCENIGVVPMF